MVEDGQHFPPKYTIALACKIITGQLLESDQFEGGAQTNGFLESLGFDVLKCDCGGTCLIGSHLSPSASRVKAIPVKHFPQRHSERCFQCKIRVYEVLKCLYGECIQNYRFPWSTLFSSYSGTSIFPVLQDVIAVLEEYRGFSFQDFVKTNNLAPCDFWIPDPGFIVEFDESQHFTIPRKLSLSVCLDDHPVGFSRTRWIDLCEHHRAKDNDPPYRDEQRAWYDILRDLVPTIKGFLPTLRLYARDFEWCSLDPYNPDDCQRFLGVAFQGNAPSSKVVEKNSVQVATANSALRAALVFPKVNAGTSDGIPPSGPGVQEPDIPTLASFAGETVDFVLFPEGYVSSDDKKRIRLLSKLSSDLNAPLFVGAVKKSLNSQNRMADWQIILRIDSDGSCSRIYTKHSTAGAIAFEKTDWEPATMLPTFELADNVIAGATICHDQYLGLLPRFLASLGACVWINPSFDNVKDIKWSSILRLRAVENSFFSLCTLHDKEGKFATHPFAFSPDGKELTGRKAGSKITQPLSRCKESESVYIVDLDMTAVGRPANWSQVPVEPQKDRKGDHEKWKLVRVKLINKKPAVLGRFGWQAVRESGCSIETDHGLVYVGLVTKERIMDSAECFQILYQAKQTNCIPVIWNIWDDIPTNLPSLATLMMGRTIECCAPILISDRIRIHELVELSNCNKIPARRTVQKSGETAVDIRFVWGLDSAFKIVDKHLPSGVRKKAFDCYRNLAFSTYK